MIRWGRFDHGRTLAGIIVCLLTMVGSAWAADAVPNQKGLFFGGSMGLGGFSDAAGGRFSITGITSRRHVGFSFFDGNALMLEYEVHRTGEERSVYDPGEFGIAVQPGLISKSLKSTFVFLSYKMKLYRGLFVRPGVGVALRKLQVPRVATGFGPSSAMDTLQSTFAPAIGVSLGYAFEITPRYILSLEYVYRECLKIDGLGPVNAFNLQVTFSRRF